MPSYTYPALRDALGVSHPTILRVARDLGIKAERSGKGPGRPYALPDRSALALAFRFRLTHGFGVARELAEHFARFVLVGGHPLSSWWLVKRTWPFYWELLHEPPTAEDREQLDAVISLGEVLKDCAEAIGARL